MRFVTKSTLAEPVSKLQTAPGLPLPLQAQLVNGETAACVEETFHWFDANDVSADAFTVESPP